METGIKMSGNSGRELSSNFAGKTFDRLPVATHFVELGEDLDQIIEKYIIPVKKVGDILCIATKVLSISKKMVVHKDDVKISFLAKLIVKYVKKWPNDIGYSNPRKMQVAINMVGYPRMLLALGLGSFLKLFGLKGYFYRIAGHRINAIDGFTVGFTKNKIFEDYAFLPPTPVGGNMYADEIEKKFDLPTVFLDGNNIENNIMGMSKSVKELYSEVDFKIIVSGNPQGQEDDGNNTPFLIVRKR